MAKPIATVYREFVNDGVPSSGPHKPIKSEIRDLLTAHYGYLTGGIAGAIVKTSKSALDGDLDHDPDTMAWVIGDATAANNGVYQKSGASGAGSWTRRAPLPYPVIRLNNAGAGTANAIVATTASGVPDSAYEAVFVLNITTANTGAVTVAVDGAAAKPLIGNTGSAIAADTLVAGMALLCVDDGSSFRILSDTWLIDAVQEKVDLAEAWAEGTEPGGPDTKSAKEWANLHGDLEEVLEDVGEQVELAEAWAEGTEPGGPGTKSAKEWANLHGDLEEVLEDVGEQVELAEAWAEGTEPGGPGTKSAKEHAIDAGNSASTASTQAGIATTRAGEADADRIAAQQASLDALSYAESYALAKIYATKAEATADLGNRSEGEWIEVVADESQNGKRVRYEIDAGPAIGDSYALPKGDPGISLDLLGRPVINQTAQGSHAFLTALHKHLFELSKGNVTEIRILQIGDSLSTESQDGLHEPIRTHLTNWYPQSPSTSRQMVQHPSATASEHEKSDYATSFVGNYTKIEPGEIANWCDGNGVQSGDRLMWPMIKKSGSGDVRVMVGETPNLRLGNTAEEWVDIDDANITSSHSTVVDSRTITDAADNGSGLVRLTVDDTSAWNNNETKTVAGVGGTTEANGDWKITVVDGTHIDLQDSAFANAYTSGGAISCNALLMDADDDDGVDWLILDYDTVAKRTLRVINNSDADVWCLNLVAVTTGATSGEYGLNWNSTHSAGSNNFANTDAGCVPFMSDYLSGYQPHIIFIEADDSMVAYQTLQAVFDAAMDGATFDYQPFVILVGNPGIKDSGGGTTPADMIDRLHFQASWAASRGYDFADMMSIALGWNNLQKIQEGSDGIHFGSFYEYGAYWYAHTRGLIRPVLEKPGGHIASDDDVRGMGAERNLQASQVQLLQLLPNVQDTGYADWTFGTPTGSASGAKEGAHIVVDSGTTANSTIRARINDQYGIFAGNVSMSRGTGSGWSTRIKLWNKTTNGQIYILSRTGSWSADYQGVLTSQGFGFRILNGVIEGIGWNSGLVVSGNSLNLASGQPNTGDAANLMVILRSSGNSNTKLVDWFVQGTSLGSAEVQTTSGLTSVFGVEVTNGADAARQRMIFTPPRFVGDFAVG